MINILKAEFFKLRKNRAALICGIIGLCYMALSILLFMLMRNTFNNIGVDGEIAGAIGIPEFTASSALYFFANDLQIFLILAVIVFCSFYAGDYKRGLVRNSLTAGQSREKVYFAKLIMVCFVSVLIFCAVTFVYMAVYGIAGGWGGVSVGKFIGFWFLELLLFLATAALVFMVSVLTKSTGATIGITIGLTFLFSILGQFGALTSIMGGAGEAANGTFFKVMSEISQLFSGAQISLASDMSLTGWRLAESIIVGAVTFILASGIGVFVFKRQDQK